MKIEIIDFVAEQYRYIEKFSNENADILWNKIVLGEKWSKLCEYSTINLDGRKPKAIRDIGRLKTQTEIMAQMDYSRLQGFFDHVISALPNYDDDTITVGILASDPANETVNRMQNGVVGTSLLGNILIQVNPLVDGFEEWIGYVFAHEYHHTVWGNYWFNLHSDRLKNDLLQALIIDGEADSFALSQCPALKPKWLYLDRPEYVESLFKKKYRTHLSEVGFDYASYMFGNEGAGIPWCGGYAVGYYLVQKYLSTAKIDFRKLIEDDRVSKFAG